MTGHPRNLTIHPDDEESTSPSADLLSHVLAQLRLTGDKVQATSLPTGHTVQLNPEMAHVVVIQEGELTVHADGGETMQVRTNELLLLPHGPGEVRLVTTGTPATIIDCSFWFDPDSRRGTALALPARIHVREEDCAAWLKPIVGFMMAEAADHQAGAALMVSRLIDLVVIRTLRSWVHQGHTSGWLGGLVDARIARAIKAIHENPRKRWSVDTLAGIAGMSRSSFHDRFTTLVGQSPQRYSNEWRLALARELLGKNDARVGQVGLSVGYGSEAAFSRAYKALYGHSPRDDVGKPSNEPFKDR
jgi:AraC-like DNA-binding protein